MGCQTRLEGHIGRMADRDGVVRPGRLTSYLPHGKTPLGVRTKGQGKGSGQDSGARLKGAEPGPCILTFSRL